MFSKCLARILYNDIQFTFTLTGKYMDHSSKNRIAFVAFIFALVLIIVLHIFIKPSFFSDSESDDVTVIRYVDNITGVQQELIDRFNEENKGKIRVELVNFPLAKFSSHERKQLLTKYLRKKSDQIDIFSADQVWIPRFSNWAEPLDKYFTDEEKGRIESSAFEYCHEDSQFIAVPLFTDIGVMYCRNDLLKLHPEYEQIKSELKNSVTWERFIEIGKSKVFRNHPFYVFSADNYEGLMCSFSELYPRETNLFSYRNSLMDNKIKFAAGFIVDLVNKYKISPDDVVLLQENNLGNFFYENNAVFLRGWPNSFPSFYYVNKNTSENEKYLCVPLPHFKGEKKRFVRGGWNLMLSKYSPNKEAALKFVKYWLSDEVQTIMYERQGFLPTLEKFYTDENLLNKYDMLKFYKELLAYSVYRPTGKYYTIFSDILTRYLKLSIKQKLTVNEALKKAEFEIKALGSGK